MMQTKTNHHSRRAIPSGSSFENWIRARYPHVGAATARLLAERAGYVIRDEWTAFYPAAVEVVASAAKAMGAAHAG